MVKSAAKEQWKKEWNQNSDNAKALRRLTKIRGVRSGLKLFEAQRDRSTVAKITQLRTGHCGLNMYLHRFNISDSPYCECGYGKETVEHYLLECRTHKEERKKLRKEAGTGKMKIQVLLGNSKVLKHTMQYITNTKRLV